MIVTQPARRTAGARHRRVVRPAVLIAALLGLFLMHGTPASAAGGCHGTMPDTAVMTAAHPAAHTAMTPPGDRATASAGHSMRGALCLATTPRPAIPLPPLSAVAVLLPAAALLPWVRRSYGDARRRGPPAGGRGLLLQVCVART
ncbi:hypothetical protein ACWCV9_22060 [Streptomyces sp. NPDC001606]